MKHRLWLFGVIAGGLWAFTLVIAGLDLFVLSAGEPAPVGTPESRFSQLSFMVMALSEATVSAVIVWRRPGNPIGWLFLVCALSTRAEAFVTNYARYALVWQPGSLPHGEATAWLGNWFWAPMMAALLLATLLLPNGRLPSPRWYPMAALMVIGPAVVGLSSILYQGSADVLDAMMFNRPSVLAVPNPIVLTPDAAQLVEQFFPDPAQALLTVCLVLSVGSLCVRYRAAGASERQQIKWVVYAAVVAGSVFLASAMGVFGGWGTVVIAIAYSLLAVALGIAVVHYRLFDIDRLINRTLVYGLLTTCLALVYWVGVALLQQLLRSLVTGAEIAVIGATLTVAVLFEPARSRVQTLVDRRFYRQRYDAQRVVSTFGNQLSQPLDQQSLTRGVLQVVSDTVHPSHAWLWMRPLTREKP